MLTLKRIRKALPAIFPRKKTATRKIGLVEVKPLAVIPDAREEIQALMAAVQEKVTDFWRTLDNYASNGEEMRESFIDAATALGFPESADIDEDTAQALAAAVEYYCSENDRLTSDTSKAINGIVDAFKVILRGKYTYYESTCDDWDLGEEIRYLITRDPNARPHWLFDFVDWEKVANTIRNEQGGMHTLHGYFQIGDIEF